MKITAATFSFLAIAAIAPAFPSHAGQFLCRSPHPYEYHQAVPASAALTSKSSDKLTVASNATALEPDGFVIFNTHSKEAAAEVHYRGRPIYRIKGTVSDADIHVGSHPLAILTTYDPKSVQNQHVSATQVVIDPRGVVTASRRINAQVGESFPHYRFTVDGSGIYRVAGGMTTIDSIEVMNSRNFRRVSSYSFNDHEFIEVVMQTPLQGFAIGESGQLFRLAAGKIIPIKAGATGFRARDIEADSRSRRILVRGSGGYRIFDWSGHLLFADNGFQTNGIAYVPSARLAIDGSVAVRDPESGNYLAYINNQGNYTQTIELPLSTEEWNDIACFTPNSAALIDWNREPTLIDFGKRR